MKINVGCGQAPTPGWRHFDNSPGLKLAKSPFLAGLLARARLLNPSQAAFVEYARSHRIEHGDAVRGLPLPACSAEAIYSCHMIEHLSRFRAGLFLEEAKRVLIPGGVLRLAVPDLGKLVRQYLEAGDADGFMESSFLSQSPPETLSGRLSFLLAGPRGHLWMYDESSLCRLLEAHGFAGVAPVPAGVTRIPDPGELDLREKESESFYVEAVKPGPGPGAREMGAASR